MRRPPFDLGVASSDALHLAGPFIIRLHLRGYGPWKILSFSHCLLCVNWSTPPTPDAFQNAVPTVDCHVFLPPPLTVSTCSENGTGAQSVDLSVGRQTRRKGTAQMITGTLPRHSTKHEGGPVTSKPVNEAMTPEVAATTAATLTAVWCLVVGVRPRLFCRFGS